MKLRALIILHPGFEELEAVAPIDLLSRAEVEVVQASAAQTLQVTGRSGITIETNHLLSQIATEIFDVVILPGGPGITQLREDAQIIKCLQNHKQAGKLIACICAAPLLLLDAKLIQDIEYTAHPSTAKELPNARNQAIVIDNNILTSPGAGTATEFALSLIQQLCSESTKKEIAASICWSHSC
ncbi:DJ-1/PfpI family protein [Coraliomargarita sp. SDUM461004]|uniref:DJ-1/PfpI family protein n=1 Tax=Thalassobacterium sedimentorum TaxID=3041258 RepID=A0ABU1AE33_9BACT|nr:DJ-1 family glyoxalase III [Coraliomargarita sp. SDUM461004]MDQ8193014.1 DJ-1/PfpI family protein [Coraliomargarita sp. SDUM461004]